MHAEINWSLTFVWCANEHYNLEHYHNFWCQANSIQNLRILCMQNAKLPFGLFNVELQKFDKMIINIAYHFVFVYQEL